MKKPLVAIRSLVYNHEPYLRDFFEGIVSQKTNFPFIAVVHDDCSTDGSVAIIREYEEKYPEIIKPIYESINQYQNGLWTEANKKMQEAFCGAKYIALCEGDDYWTDPLKLQKQVDYMEAHPECSCCAHNSLTLNTQTRGIGLFNKKILQTQDYTLESFITKEWFTPTASLLYRYCDYQLFEDLPSFMHGDYSLLVNILLKPGTYLHYDNDIMSVYRDGGWASTHYKEMDIYNDSIVLFEYYKTKSNHRCDAVFDTLISHEKALIDAYLQHIENTKKSKSLMVRIGHWICRNIASLANKKVQCLYVTKTVKMDSIPNIEKLD